MNLDQRPRVSRGREDEFKCGARARARELDSAERKATADQLIAHAVIPIAPPDDERREARSLSLSPRESALRLAIHSTLLLVCNTRVRIDMYVHLRTVVMRSTRNACVRVQPLAPPADQPAPIVKAESRVAFPSIERGATQNAMITDT